MRLPPGPISTACMAPRSKAGSSGPAPKRCRPRHPARPTRGYQSTAAQVVCCQLPSRPPSTPPLRHLLLLPLLLPRPLRCPPRLARALGPPASSPRPLLPHPPAARPTWALPTLQPPACRQCCPQRPLRARPLQPTSACPPCLPCLTSLCCPSQAAAALIPWTWSHCSPATCCCSCWRTARERVGQAGCAGAFPAPPPS